MDPVNVCVAVAVYDVVGPWVIVGFVSEGETVNELPFVKLLETDSCCVDVSDSVLTSDSFEWVGVSETVIVAVSVSV
jgi:hypothetical protein